MRGFWNFDTPDSETFKFPSDILKYGYAEELNSVLTGKLKYGELIGNILKDTDYTYNISNPAGQKSLHVGDVGLRSSSYKHILNCREVYEIFGGVDYNLYVAQGSSFSHPKSLNSALKKFLTAEKMVEVLDSYSRGEYIGKYLNRVIELREYGFGSEDIKRYCSDYNAKLQVKMLNNLAIDVAYIVGRVVKHRESLGVYCTYVLSEHMRDIYNLLDEDTTKKYFYTAKNGKVRMKKKYFMDLKSELTLICMSMAGVGEDKTLGKLDCFTIASSSLLEDIKSNILFFSQKRVDALKSIDSFKLLNKITERIDKSKLDNTLNFFF